MTCKNRIITVCRPLTRLAQDEEHSRQAATLAQIEAVNYLREAQSDLTELSHPKRS
jgi:hypothetical protein